MLIGSWDIIYAVALAQSKGARRALH